MAGTQKGLMHLADVLCAILCGGWQRRVQLRVVMRRPNEALFLKTAGTAIELQAIFAIVSSRAVLQAALSMGGHFMRNGRNLMPQVQGHAFGNLGRTGH